MLGLAPMPLPCATTCAERRLVACAGVGAAISTDATISAASVVVDLALLPRTNRWVVMNSPFWTALECAGRWNGTRRGRENPEGVQPGRCRRATTPTGPAKAGRTR